MILASETLMEAIETLKEIVSDMEACTDVLYAGSGDLCDVAGDRISDVGRTLRKEVAFIEKLAEGARILEARE